VTERNFIALCQEEDGGLSAPPPHLDIVGIDGCLVPGEPREVKFGYTGRITMPTAHAKAIGWFPDATMSIEVTADDGLIHRFAGVRGLWCEEDDSVTFDCRQEDYMGSRPA